MRKGGMLTGVIERFCFWSLLAGIFAAGSSGRLSTLDALFEVLGLILLGMACVLHFLSPSRAAKSERE